MWRRADGESPRPKKVLAVASGGGHWIELLRVIKAFDGQDIRFVTVRRAYRHDVPGHRLHVVTDATRWNPFRVGILAIQMLAIAILVRPSIVISTGSAPGLFGLVFGRLLGARTIWLDSLANVDRVSLSGSLARPFAGLWLTQWPHLARRQGPEYAGQVL
jgi:exopolysaccharide biosynthesis glucuronosyltransferase PssD